MRESLKPFLDPDLRYAILAINEAVEQVIDEATRDALLEGTGFSEAAREKAKGTMADLRAFCEQHRHDIEALTLLYSKPYRRGLRYRQVRELAQKLAVAPFHIDPRCRPRCSACGACRTKPNRAA